MDDLGILFDNPTGLLGPFQSRLHHRQKAAPLGFAGIVGPTAHIVISLPGLKA